MDRPKRKANHLKDYDYSQPGCYFITICTKDRKHLFWDGETDLCSVGAACGRPPLSKLGRCVENEIEVLSTTYPMVGVDKFVVMPNHVHIMVNIFAPEDRRPQAVPTIARVVNQFKGAVTKTAGRHIWQKGYHDHVIWNDADYLRIWDYIDTNLAKWREDCYYTEGTKI